MMTKLTITILTIALAITALPAQANETETKLQATLQKRIETLSRAVKKYETMNQALQRVSAENRADTLRIVCRRVKDDTAAVAKAIDSIDLYLELTTFSRGDAIELERTNKSINTIKSQIHQLKNKVKPATIAAK